MVLSSISVIGNESKTWNVELMFLFGNMTTGMSSGQIRFFLIFFFIEKSMRAIAGDVTLPHVLSWPLTTPPVSGWNYSRPGSHAIKYRISGKQSVLTLSAYPGYAQKYCIEKQVYNIICTNYTAIGRVSNRRLRHWYLQKANYLLKLNKM